MSELSDKARELGYTIKKGPMKFSGYVLKSHDDEYPLGDDFRASLSDIEDYLEIYAADISAGRVKKSDDDDAEPEVETGAKLAEVKPPSRQKIAAVLRDHAAPAEIKAMFKAPPKQTKQEINEREALDNLLWVVNDPRASAAFYKQPKEVQNAHWKRLRLALEQDEKAKAAKLPKSTITIQDLEREERARQARKFHKINERWRTNIDSIRDPLTEHERDWQMNNFRHPERDQAEWLAAIDRENAAFIPPEHSTDYAPKPSTGFKVTSKGRRKLAA